MARRGKGKVSRNGAKVATKRRSLRPFGMRLAFFGLVPVVSLADSLNHRLMDWQASGLHLPHIRIMPLFSHQFMMRSFFYHFHLIKNEDAIHFGKS